MSTAGEVVLVVAAHPDDEALGCGGTMARHARAGDRVHVVLVADGVASRGATAEAEARELARRRASATTAVARLGAAEPVFLDFADQRLDMVPLLEITQAIERIAASLRPTIVYTHHSGDLNLDHRRVAQAVMTAFRPVPGQTVKCIYGFEVLSSTEWAFGVVEPAFAPARFVGIAPYLETKLAALRDYEQEMRPFPHSRSHRAVEALARLRGAAVGLEAAEAFTVIRETLA